jgi:hypothetical protein
MRWLLTWDLDASFDTNILNAKQHVLVKVICRNVRDRGVVHEARELTCPPDEIPLDWTVVTTNTGRHLVKSTEFESLLLSYLHDQCVAFVFIKDVIVGPLF